MAYTKTTWTETTGITPARLNNMETGIGETHWYGVTTNSGNAYSVTLNPAPSAYYAGMRITIKVNAANTGSATINCNGLGARAINKPNGNNLFAGNFKADSVYTLIHNGTSFFLQGSDSTGNATASNVLAGKTFSNDINTDLVGTMPNHGAKVITPSTVNQAIAAGYHNGSGYVQGSANLVPANIKNGVSIFGVVGNVNEVKIATGTVDETPYGIIQVTGLNFSPKVVLFNSTTYGLHGGLYNQPILNNILDYVFTTAATREEMEDWVTVDNCYGFLSGVTYSASVAGTDTYRFVAVTSNPMTSNGFYYDFDVNFGGADTFEWVAIG